MTDLKRLLDEATPLPWEYASDKLAAGNIKAMCNARLICAAVNAVPELLALRKAVKSVIKAQDGGDLDDLFNACDDLRRAALNQEPGQ